jgi:hypothetical protein
MNLVVRERAADSEGKTVEKPVAVVSVLLEDGFGSVRQPLRAIMMHKTDNYVRFVLQREPGSTSKWSSQDVIRAVKVLPFAKNATRVVEANSPKLQDALAEFEKKDTVKEYKFGVLYQGQV